MHAEASVRARTASRLTNLGALIAASALSIGCPLAVEDDYVIGSEDAGAGSSGSGGSGGSGSAGKGSAGKGGTGTGGNAGTSSGGSGGGPAPTCSDKQRNGSETDVDCGGNCPPCGLGATCESKNDCESEHCDSSTKKCVESD